MGPSPLKATFAGYGPTISEEMRPGISVRFRHPRRHAGGGPLRASRKRDQVVPSDWALNREQDRIVSPFADRFRPSEDAFMIFTDPHLNDHTVSAQHMPLPLLERMFTEAAPSLKGAKRLHVVMGGDTLDFLRTEVFAKRGVMPWESRDRVEPVLREIWEGILAQNREILERFRPEHVKARFNEDHYLELETVEIVDVLGNHDRPILDHPEVRGLFYEAIGMKLDDDRKREIGILWGDENRWLGQFREPPYPYPWFAALDLFVIHGHFKDRYNFAGPTGWHLQEWRQTQWQAWKRSNFGETVVFRLSEMIYEIRKGLQEAGIEDPQLEDTLRKMDIIRPASAGIKWVLSQILGDRFEKQAREIIQDIAWRVLKGWLTDDFVWQEVSRLQDEDKTLWWKMKAAKWWLTFSGREKGLEALRKLMASIGEEHGEREDLKWENLIYFPAFRYGYLYGVQGHTHDPREEPALVDRNRGSMIFYDLGTAGRSRVQRIAAQDSYSASQHLIVGIYFNGRFEVVRLSRHHADMDREVNA